MNANPEASVYPRPICVSANSWKMPSIIIAVSPIQPGKMFFCCLIPRGHMEGTCPAESEVVSVPHDPQDDRGQPDQESWGQIALLYVIQKANLWFFIWTARISYFFRLFESKCFDFFSDIGLVRNQYFSQVIVIRGQCFLLGKWTPLKLFCCSHTCTVIPLGAVWSSVSCSRTPGHVNTRRIEPATLLLNQRSRFSQVESDGKFSPLICMVPRAVVCVSAVSTWSPYLALSGLATLRCRNTATQRENTLTSCWGKTSGWVW